MYARCRRWPTRACASRSPTRLASTRRRRSSRASWPSCGLHPECCTSSSASGPGRSRPRCSSLRRSPGGQVMPHSNHESDRSNASGVSRREVLCAGGAAAFSSLVAALLGGSERARAQGLAGPVPEVDYLAVRVVTDSYQLAIAPNMKVGEVEVQRFGMPPAGRSLLGEFGLSMHLESRRGEETRNMLLDFGFTSGTLNNNLQMLGIAPESIDVLILSHGHYDHFGGLVGFLQQNRAKLRSELPLYVGGEECFCSREWTIGKPQDFGASSEEHTSEPH